MIVIREAIASDISSICSIAHATWAVAYKDILSTEQMEYMLESMYSNKSLVHQINTGHRFIMLLQNDIPEGFISFEFGYGSVTVVKIHKYYILPSTQGKGLGTRLLDTITELAKQQGMDTITLNVNRFNESVEHYKARGFSIVGSEDIDIGNGFLMEDYIMEKKIS